MTKRLPSSTPATATRRAFCCGTASLLAASYALPGKLSLAQTAAPLGGTPTRPDVAATDHDRILAMAERSLAQPPTPLTSLPSPRSPGTPHDYHSEAQPAATDGLARGAAPTPFTAHRDAVFKLGLAVPALAAAHLLTGDERFARHAALHLRAWFVDPTTRMTPGLNFGQVRTITSTHPSSNAEDPGSTLLAGRYEGILETLPLIEIALALPFLSASPAMPPSDLAAIKAWFAAYLKWLTAEEDSGPRLAALARDQKDHHATSWLLQASAYALLAVGPGDVARAEDSMLGHLRQRFKKITLRSQISPAGTFPRELSSPTPYRDSLFNLDMVAGICLLLSTRFESVFDYALEDGPSMRSAIAYHFPFITDRGLWPFRADVEHFDQLPARRASLLFTARAYQRPEYAALWRTLPPDPASPDVLRTVPIHQPLLWVRQPPPPA